MSRMRFFTLVSAFCALAVGLFVWGSSANAAITSVTLSDPDIAVYGLSGGDFQVAWNSDTSTPPVGFQYIKVFIASSTANLTTSTVNTLQYGSMNTVWNSGTTTVVLPPYINQTAHGEPLVTTTNYVAWVYVQAAVPTIVSSTAVSYANGFDNVADTFAPMIDHMSVHVAAQNTNAYIYSFIYDGQTSGQQFANPGDGGAEYFRIYYTTNTTWGSFANGTPVNNNFELYQFIVPTTSVPAAPGSFKYYLAAVDSTGQAANTRFFCANPSATSAADCQASPFVVNTVPPGTITVSGNVVSNGAGVSGATVFAAGSARPAVSANGSGGYSVTNLPANDAFDFVAAKVGFCRNTRFETIGSVNKSFIDFSLTSGSCSFFEGNQGQANTGAPMVVFSGPQEGMNNVPVSTQIRVGLNQPMDQSTINDLNAADSSNNVYLTTDSGLTKVGGSVVYCQNSSSAGCSGIPSQDTNVILFVPTTALATNTFYSLVINENVKSQGSGQSIQGNKQGGGHKISFTTVGNYFADAGAYTMGASGQFMPPYVKAMTPAPGMTVAPNVDVLLEFNQALDSTTVNTSNITLWSGATQITSGVIVVLDSNEKRFATLSHNALSAGEYTVKVKGAVKSASGVSMLTNTANTAFNSSFIVSGSSDTTAPTIYPMLANNATVAVNTIFDFGFNEQLSFGSVNPMNITLYRGSTLVGIDTRYDAGKNSVSVAPNNVLVPNTVYTLTFTSGVKDLANVGLATTTYTYTTGVADTGAPSLKEARCDDFTCKIFFTEPMNHDNQAGNNYTSSVLKPELFTIERTAPTTQTFSLTGKPVTYDVINKSVTFQGIAGLAAGDSFRVTVSTTVADLSGNAVTSTNSQNIFNGKVENSGTTFGSFGDMGMFGPPTSGLTGGGSIGGGEFKPQGFGSFTSEQFAMGQADMAYPFNPMASNDSNVFQVKFTPGVIVQAGDVVDLTFPAGTTVTNAALDIQSPYYADFNQFMAGTVTGTAISSDNVSGRVSVTLGVSGSPIANDQLTIDLRKIINPPIPKGPNTGGYTVGIKIKRAGAAIVSKTSMPYFIMAGGTNTLVVDVVAGTNTSTPANGASGTVYLHGGGPGGPMDKMLTMTNGDISAVDGTAGTSITYSNLPNGCYFVGTEPYITLGGSDYYGQMSSESVCLSGGSSQTKWILLSPASGSNTTAITVKMVDSNGNPYVFGGKDIDIFASGPGKFVVKTLTGVTTTLAGGYQVKLNSNGSWFVGMGPAMPKSTSGGKPTSLGVMPPPSINLMVTNIDTSPVVTVSGGTPPGVAYSNGTITYTFAATNKTITGTVKDGSGNALANVEVFVHRQGFGMSIFTQTNAVGTFSLGVSDYGNYEIGAMMDGMPPVMKNIEVKNESGTKIYVDGKDVTSNFVLTLKKASYTISGKVLDSSSNGIGYAPVMGVDANGNTVFGQTSSDGSYTLFVDNGTWTVRSELPPSKTDACGTWSKTVTVSGSSQANQNVTPAVTTCYALSGTVSVGGSNLANVPLFVEEWDNTNNRPLPGGAKKGASTDSNGAYSVQVGAGNYRIGTLHPDYGELSVTTTVSGAAPNTNITVASTDTITFNFTGGTATMNAFVELKNANDKNKRIGKQVSGLNSATVLTAQALTSYNYFVDVFGIGKFSGSVNTTAGSDSVTINLGLSGSDYVTVTGTVYVDSATTTGKTGALVTFANASTTVSATTDANGQYSAKLKAGTYTVTDSLSGYLSTQPASVAFTTSTAGYDFGGASPDKPALLTAGYVVTGTVYASDGVTAMTDGYVWGTNASGTVVSSPISSANGSYSLSVTNGVWVIKAIGPKHIETERAAVTISGADQTGKNITLTAASSGANVPTSTAGIIAADTGGSLNDSAASGIKLTAGQGVLETGSGNVTLNFEKNYTAPDTETYRSLGNASFSISASGESAIKDLKGNVEIQLDYSSLLAQLPANVSESNLQLAYYSPEKDEYVPVEGGFTVDVANNTITGLVDHFTDFVITYQNGSAGVTVTEGDNTAVTEGGATDTYTIVLTSQPISNVVITPSASGSRVSVSPSSLTFTTVNWATPQTITVTAVNDTAVEGTHTDTITHAISSSDPDYNGVSIGNVTVTITDNDSSSAGGGSPAYTGDTTPPTNTSISIASGAVSTLSTAVALTLGATDASSMMISNTSDFAGASWETYSTTKSWTLTSGSGTKTVYAKFRDSNNNVSTAVSDTITLTGTTTATSTPVTTATSTTPVTTGTETFATPATSQAATANTGATPATTAASSAAQSSASAYKFSKTLKLGSTNAEVKELQRVLKKLGHFKYPTLTTNFGTATKAALIAYQKSQGLSKTGTLDTATRKALNGESSGTTVSEPTTTSAVVATGYKFTKYLNVGSQGEEVKQLQLKLKELGFFSGSSATGYFGPATKAAVVKFQKANKLSTAPGWIGPGTREKLNAQ